MTSTIGLRVYQLNVYERGNRTPLKLNTNKLKETTLSIIDSFITKNSNLNQNDQLERTWFLEPHHSNHNTERHGYIRYGTFGFESQFIDNKTKKPTYKRKTTDTEQIPLYYRFSLKDGEYYGFLALQSFQGRSCVTIFTANLIATFERKNPGYTLAIKKIVPNNEKNSALYQAPVKGLRLIKKNEPSDIADSYFNKGGSDSVNIELRISARRNKNLGPLGLVFKKLETSKENVIVYENIEFPEAIAEIRTGKKIRKVGVLGPNGDAGVIDITDSIKKGADGHPAFHSIAEETGAILEDFHNILMK